MFVILLQVQILQLKTVQFAKVPCLITPTHPLSLFYLQCLGVIAQDECRHTIPNEVLVDKAHERRLFQLALQ